MITTTINIDVFEKAYRSGLLFSLFEGLKEGENFRIVSKDNLDEIKMQLITTLLGNISLQEKKSRFGLCEIEIQKASVLTRNAIPR